MKGNLPLLLLHFPRAPISSSSGNSPRSPSHAVSVPSAGVPASTFLRPQGLLQAALLAAGVSHAPSLTNDVCVSVPPSSSSASPSLPVLPSPVPLLPQGHGQGHCGPVNYPVRTAPVMLVKFTLHCLVW